MSISPLAGKPAPASILADIPKLIAAYYLERPDPKLPQERVSFGTSGHRGSSLHRAFNESHILAVTQAICAYRNANGIDGPLFIGHDTHPLSWPAFATALEVLAANGVETRVSLGNLPTPTPAVSLAILRFNANRTRGLADGIVITPSHNPPEDGGFKYNPPNGGPAGSGVTRTIQDEANALLEASLGGVRRVPFEQALRASTTLSHDFVDEYVRDLENVLDMDLIRDSGLRLGVDPLGGAGLPYWEPIAERYKLNLTVVNKEIDHTFRFMTVDWDGRIRMDPSSTYAMQSLIALRDKFDIAFACDTDHDRHGIVTRSAGLLPPNHYLAVAIDYLFSHRPGWGREVSIGKTVVSSSMIDKVAAADGVKVYEVPVGFKFFVDGLLGGRLGYAGEESAGLSLLRKDATVWTTDKDGLVAALLSAEITARTGRDPGQLYAELEARFGRSDYQRIDAPANAREREILARLSPESVLSKELAGETISQILTTAPGDKSPLGGVKVITQNGWFAARPSGTEDVYKIYAESFRGVDHLKQIQQEAQAIVGQALRSSPS
jgi:phosphoglucomutase